MTIDVKQGTFISAIGKVSLDSSGQLVMTKLVALLAGGVSQATKLLKRKIREQTKDAALLTIVSGCLLFLTGAMLVNNYRTYRYRREIADMESEVDKINQQLQGLRRLPTKFTEAGTFCVICQDKASQVIFVPCNHVNCCYECI